MRFLTGGFAIWMGGWTCQIHHRRDMIGDLSGDLSRSDLCHKLYLEHSVPFEEGVRLLAPAAALADGLVFRDHPLTPPDEIDRDYLEEPQVESVEKILRKLGVSEDRLNAVLAPYHEFLHPDDFCDPGDHFR